MSEYKPYVCDNCGVETNRKVEHHPIRWKRKYGIIPVPYVAKEMWCYRCKYDYNAWWRRHFEVE